MTTTIKLTSTEAAQALTQIRAYREGYITTMAAADRLASAGNSGPISNPYESSTAAYRAWELGSDDAIKELDAMQPRT